MAEQIQTRLPSGANEQIDEQPVSPSDPRRPSIQLDDDLEAQIPVERGTMIEKLISKGIYWRSPAAMACFFLLGVVMAISNHVYYSHMDGKLVGNDFQQQWVLRGGNTFAYLTEISLTTSIGFSYTQWLWWALERSRISVAALDAAFDGTLASVLLCTEMIRKVKVGTFLAFMTGLLPLICLVPPATLFVLPSLRDNNDSIGPARVLDMSSPNQWARFAHSANSSDQTKTSLLGPRTLPERLSSATASRGEILPIAAPFPNATFPLQFFGPSVTSVTCEEADTQTAIAIDMIRDDDMRNNSVCVLAERSNYFYAFVPDLTTNAGERNSSSSGVVPVPAFRPARPQNASNELWMAYSQYTGNLDSRGDPITKDQYLVCRLYNASYNVNVTFEDGTQKITNLNTTNLNLVEYPKNDSPIFYDILQQHAYSAVFWAMTDLLVGSMGFFVQNSSPPMSFTEIKTDLQYISLIGSPDLQPFFDSNRPGDHTISDQRRQDIDLAHKLPPLVMGTPLKWAPSLHLPPQL